MTKNYFNLEELKFPTGKFQKPDSITENDLKNWISITENFPSNIKKLTSNLSVEELNWMYRPHGWSIKQVVHHCADSHINSFVRFKLALTEDTPTIKLTMKVNGPNLLMVILTTFYLQFKSSKEYILVGFCF